VKKERLEKIKMTEKPDISIRNFQGGADYDLIHSILMESTNADGIVENATLDDIRNWCAPSNRFDPKKDILFALDKREVEKNTEIGFSRVSWYTGKDDTRLYFQTSFLLPEWRGQGVWSAMVTSHPQTPSRFFQAWATDAQTEWRSVLERSGYKAVRHFNNMLRDLDAIPDRDLPAGLEVHPIQTTHYRSIWEAQREVHEELFETVAENWTDDNYDNWLKNPSHTPDIWQVAWDGDQVAGMVLPRINTEGSQTSGRNRGYAEHIFVRKPWRKRGLASALLVRSLKVLKAQGMDEAELGVDSENESGAYEFYRRMGFRTYYRDIWFHKQMAANNDGVT
jgi:ribosomal protein S18 acetylase RimI-like enzyme